MKKTKQVEEIVAEEVLKIASDKLDWCKPYKGWDMDEMKIVEGMKRLTITIAYKPTKEQEIARAEQLGCSLETLEELSK